MLTRFRCRLRSSLSKQQMGTCTLVFGLQADCFMFILQRSPEFNDFLRKALDKNVDNRWSSVQLVQVSDIVCTF